MLLLVVFIVIQILTSLLVKYFASLHWKRIFRILFIPLFIVLMAIYPIWTVDVFFVREESVRCGLPIMAMMFFFWIIGVPVALITQLLLNKYILKLKPTNTNNK